MLVATVVTACIPECSRGNLVAATFDCLVSSLHSGRRVSGLPIDVKISGLVLLSQGLQS